MHARPAPGWIRASEHISRLHFHGPDRILQFRFILFLHFLVCPAAVLYVTQLLHAISKSNLHYMMLETRAVEYFLVNRPSEIEVLIFSFIRKLNICHFTFFYFWSSIKSIFKTNFGLFTLFNQSCLLIWAEFDRKIMSNSKCNLFIRKGKIRASIWDEFVRWPLDRLDASIAPTRVEWLAFTLKNGLRSTCLTRPRRKS